MSTRGPGRRSARARRGALAALGIATAAALSGCGSEDFADNPRPAAGIDVGARIDSKKVVVSPDKFGAGLVTFTVANLSPSPVRFELRGPKNGSSSEIPPGAPGSLQINLPEGDYRATAGRGVRVQPATITVGRQRPSSKGELLLP
jgi:hypothetical protein